MKLMSKNTFKSRLEGKEKLRKTRKLPICWDAITTYGGSVQITQKTQNKDSPQKDCG